MKPYQLYEQFWNLCNEFKSKTNRNANYIEYISALLYLKYYKAESRSFQKIYEEKENFYINKKIDEELEFLREEIGDPKIFSDIQFKGIVFYRNLGEKNILSRAIESIESFSKEFSKGQIAEAYELIIKQSAMNGDTKRTEEIFYTPKEIANIMVNMLIEKEGAEIYDPMCSSGNFLIEANQEKDAKIFGEEDNIEYYSIFKTRVLLKGIKDEKIESENRKYDHVILNPPFSQKSWKEEIQDPTIFYEYELSSSAVGDYAYVLRALQKLKENGKMAFILPHGVLFRENEKNVRKRLIEKNEIEAIIGLPENLFYDTRIPVIILVIGKNRKDEGVLFMDASNEFEIEKGNHILTQEHRDKIIDVYQNKKEIEGFSRMIPKKEIAEKDFNLSIKKYIRKRSKRKTIEHALLIKKLRDLENEKDILEENIKDILTVLNVKGFQEEKKEYNVKYEFDDRKVGRNIRKARIEKKYTQEMLAEQLSLSPRYISQLERGMTGMRLETLANVCNALKVPMEEMIK